MSSRIYNNRNKIKFTNISVSYKVAKQVQGVVQQMHSNIITYVCSHFKDTKRYKEQVVYILNLVTYYAYTGDNMSFKWSVNQPFVNVPEVSQEDIEEALGDVLLTVDAIDWDVKPAGGQYIPEMSRSASVTIELESSDNAKEADINKAAEVIVESLEKQGATVVKSDSNSSSSRKRASNNLSMKSAVIAPTPKQDLYIQPPSIPQFDYKRPWLKNVQGADTLVIYTTLPEIPTKQNEISVTTDVTRMTESELMKLYPNYIVHTRASVMYEPLDGVELDPDIGLILPIEGFTREQIIDNIIRYPHIFKLTREVDGNYYSFYSHLEIDGELHGTLDVWNNLPESRILPRQAEFVKEYVVRRYLLERDVKGIKHKYPLFGTFDEFLTLFMTPDDYIRRGYSDVTQIVKKCVLSRVSYKQSRNPIMRRLNYV